MRSSLTVARRFDLICNAQRRVSTRQKIPSIADGLIVSSPRLAKNDPSPSRLCDYTVGQWGAAGSELEDAVPRFLYPEGGAHAGRRAAPHRLAQAGERLDGAAVKAGKGPGVRPGDGPHPKGQRLSRNAQMRTQCANAMRKCAMRHSLSNRARKHAIVAGARPCTHAPAHAVQGHTAALGDRLRLSTPRGDTGPCGPSAFFFVSHFDDTVCERGDTRAKTAY